MVARTSILITADDRTQAAFSSIQRNVIGFQRGLRAAQASVVGLFGVEAIRGASAFTQALIETRKQFDSINLTFQQGFGEKAAEELDFVREQADRLGLSFRTLAGNYSKAAIAAQGTSLEGEGLRTVFLGVSEAAAVFNLSQQDTDGVMRAVIQSISKGTIQAEELRGQLGDRLPGAFKIFAQSIGVTETELDKFLEQGLIRADLSLVEFGKRLREIVGPNVAKASETLRAESARLGNAWDELKDTLSQGVFEDALKGGIIRTKNALEGLNDALSLTGGLIAEFNQLSSGLDTALGITPNESTTDFIFRQAEDAARFITDLTGTTEGFQKFREGVRDYLIQVGKVQEAGPVVGEQSAENIRPTAAALAALQGQWDKYVAAGQSRAQKVELEIKNIAELGKRMGKTTEEIKANQDAYRRQNSGSSGSSGIDKELRLVASRAEDARERLAELRREIRGMFTDDVGRQDLLVEELEQARAEAEKGGARESILAKLDSELESERQISEEMRRQAQLQGVADEFERSRQASEDPLNDVREETEAIREQVDAMMLEMQAVDGLDSSIEQLIIARKEDQLAMLESQGASADLVAALREQIEARKELRDAYVAQEGQEDLDELERQAERTADGWNRVGLAIAGSFENAVVSGGNLRDMIDGIEADLVRIITRILFTQPVGNAIGGYLNSIVGAGIGAAAGGGMGASGATVGQADAYTSLFLNSGTGRAIGGTVRANTMHRVGETEPEILFAGGKSYLIPPQGGGRVEPIERSSNGEMTQKVEIHVHGIQDEGGLRRSATTIAKRAGLAVSRGSRNS